MTLLLVVWFQLLAVAGVTFFLLLVIKINGKAKCENGSSGHHSIELYSQLFRVHFVALQITGEELHELAMERANKMQRKGYNLGEKIIYFFKRFFLGKNITVRRTHPE